MRARTGRRALAVLVACALAATLVACGSGGGGTNGSSQRGAANGQPGKGKPAVTLGDKNFTEQFVLGQLYAQALRAKGYTVHLQPNVGSSELIYKALTSGRVDLYPEYTGVLVSDIAGQTNPPPTGQAAYARARAFASRHGLRMLARTPFVDTDALAVTGAYARRERLRAIPDLRRLGAITYAGPPELRNREQGYAGLRRVYGLRELRFKALPSGVQYVALNRGQIQVADVLTTDGLLGRGHYVVLADPKHLFGFQNVAPLVRRQVLRAEGPAFARTLDAVSAKLTTEAMRRMNAAVELDKLDPAAVADRFLRSNGLK